MLIKNASTPQLDVEGLARAAEQAAERFAESNPKSAAAHIDALAVMPGGNTRSVLFYAPFPLTIARGEGKRLWDLDGHAYTDYLAEYTTAMSAARSASRSG